MNLEPPSEHLIAALLASSRRSKASISAIVTVNNEEQFALNAARSPGLAEVDCEIIACRNNVTAAEAFSRGRAAARGEWLLFCHQDVYFPHSFGFALSEILSAIPKEQTDLAVIGFVGIGSRSKVPPYAEAFRAGLVVDRTVIYDWPEAEVALSIEELALVLHRDSRLVIDPSLGWHVWGTDLCLQALTQGGAGRIVRAPVYHNSTLSGFPADYSASAARLREKYPHIVGIQTLNGRIS